MEDASVIRIRLRGIYATALTERLSGPFEVVQASDPIQQRFDETFVPAPHDVSIETTSDRQGVGIIGDTAGVEQVAETLGSIDLDTFAWEDTTPLGTIVEADVIDTLGSGAIVDMGQRQGFLSYDDADDYVDEGKTYVVQIHEPRSPWGDRRPGVSTEVRAFGGIVDLVRGASGVMADVDEEERAEELSRITEMLPTEIPEEWGVRWNQGASNASLEDLDAALSSTVTLVEECDDQDDGLGRGTTWIWFGRESRFALDEHRREVTPTMTGHHRIKAGGRGASTAVDFVERLAGQADEESANILIGDGTFPAEATFGQFGPSRGEEIEIVHGKPDGSVISLGQGTVSDRDGETVIVKRELRGGGRYDALGTPKEAGDVATTTFREGRWWYPTTYHSDAGETKGTYVNVCTPVEVFPTEARYVDLYVDVVQRPDGMVERVDHDELRVAVTQGDVSEPLARKAEQVAEAVGGALS